MDQQEWYRQWNDRTNRYAQRILDPARAVAITTEPARLARFDTQVALLSAANLLGRMTPNVKLSFPDVALHPDLPWRGLSLHAYILSGMNQADPHGRFVAGAQNVDDFEFHYGRSGEGFVVDGSGWNAYHGPGRSPLPDEVDGNPFGAALAVILAASHLFRHPFIPFSSSYVCNALDWTEGPAPSSMPLLNVDLGRLFFIGLGSVGTAALYYLTLATRLFTPTLFDMDRVKIQNLSRSPIFLAEDCGTGEDGGIPKVAAAKRFLKQAGLTDVTAVPLALHESSIWVNRESGVPDLIVSAANEQDVRFHIEMGYPPIQIYATTGRNWQVALLRHLPDSPSCSLCRFPPEESSAPMACATDNTRNTVGDRQVDAALPFLSFAAGLMTAADIVKLSFPGFPFASPQVTLNLRADPCIIKSPLQHHQGCTCEYRDKGVYRGMIAGSRYAILS